MLRLICCTEYGAARVREIPRRELVEARPLSRERCRRCVRSCPARGLSRRALRADRQALDCRKQGRGCQETEIFTKSLGRCPSRPRSRACCMRGRRRLRPTSRSRRARLCSAGSGTAKPKSRRCSPAPASCLRVSSKCEGFPLIIPRRVCRQVTTLSTTTNEAGLQGVSLGGVILTAHVPSRRRAVDNTGARYFSAGSLRDFGVVRTIGRGFVANKAPFACHAFPNYSYFSIHAVGAAKRRANPERIRLFLHDSHALKLHWDAHCG